MINTWIEQMSQQRSLTHIPRVKLHLCIFSQTTDQESVKDVA
jgi:hypothetical protein